MPRKLPPGDREVGCHRPVGLPEAAYVARAEPAGRAAATAPYQRLQIVPCRGSLRDEVVYRTHVQLDERVTVATPEGVTIELVLAGLGSRFIARLLDTLIQAAVIFALAFAGFAASGNDFDGIAVAVTSVGGFAMLFGYDIVLETLNNGRTPGKTAAGIRVTGTDGEPVTFVQSAVRNLLRLADFLPALYLTGSIAIVATGRDQRLGDLAAGTIVVRERFGGRNGEGDPAAPVTVPLAQVATWDVSAIDGEELRVVRHFLERRLAMPWPVRTYFGSEIMRRLAPKVVGAPPDPHPEYLLEGIVVAKQSRS